MLCWLGPRTHLIQHSFLTEANYCKCTWKSTNVPVDGIQRNPITSVNWFKPFLKPTFKKISNVPHKMCSLNSGSSIALENKTAANKQMEEMMSFFGIQLQWGKLKTNGCTKKERKEGHSHVHLLVISYTFMSAKLYSWAFHWSSSLLWKNFQY